ncbi:MAG: ABC transporter permease subunit [Gemmatimonadetes bacterium]|jgi:Cu-processing system permease protein|nr:ABC transporter permease subunit [Gemmatimonadota bacterium]MBT5059416.1 ABC transporter permease subunit [Gemmatimonadota bacterium]MBT5146504.1 ABC transporter permease subunit [Gemmatimonadota bacterium]MBT5591425.1 ABC transporter permease subunit [Gemmatimonadota bacterium]MBT5962120.1 ABC transporter permease subunit [Gemmatimonadota bacterium]
MMDMRPMLYLAMKELVANLKSWWIVIMGLLCALLSWTVGSYGFSFASGDIGQETVLVSLIHLQLYIVPLLGLLVSYDAVLGERDSGMFDVHLALGVGRLSFLAGKWIGLSASLFIALIPSLILQATAFLAAGGAMSSFFILLLHCGLLCSAVISIGLFISSWSLNRSTVVSLCIGSWLVLAILIDFIVVSLLAATQGNVPDWLVNGMIIGNPLGSYRLLSYLHFFPEQVEALLYTRETGWMAATSVMALWIVAPLLATGYRLSRIYRPITWQEVE